VVERIGDFGLREGNSKPVWKVLDSGALLLNSIALGCILQATDSPFGCK
jgi:hypothetical protein